MRYAAMIEPDPKDVGHARGGLGDRNRDASLELDEIAIRATDVAEELEREPATFDTDRVFGPDATQLGCGPCRGKVLGKPTGDELTQHRMQATDRPGPMRDQVVVTFREESQHCRVVLEADDTQFRVAQRHDRRGSGVVRVGLVAPRVVEQADPRRECRWHIEHSLTGRDELLGQQGAGAGRAFDRPTPWLEGCRERQQAIALRTIRPDTNLAHEPLVAVEHRRRV